MKAPKSWKIYLLHAPFVLRTVAIIMVILILARPQKLRHGTARSGLPPVWNALPSLSLTTCYGTDFQLFTGLGKPTIEQKAALKNKKRDEEYAHYDIRPYNDLRNGSEKYDIALTRHLLLIVKQDGKL